MVQSAEGGGVMALMVMGVAAGTLVHEVGESFRSLPHHRRDSSTVPIGAPIMARRIPHDIDIDVVPIPAGGFPKPLLPIAQDLYRDIPGRLGVVIIA